MCNRYPAFTSFLQYFQRLVSVRMLIPRSDRIHLSEKEGLCNSAVERKMHPPHSSGFDFEFNVRHLCEIELPWNEYSRKEKSLRDDIPQPNISPPSCLFQNTHRWYPRSEYFRAGELFFSAVCIHIAQPKTNVVDNTVGVTSCINAASNLADIAVSLFSTSNLSLDSNMHGLYRCKHISAYYSNRNTSEQESNLNIWGAWYASPP